MSAATYYRQHPLPKPFAPRATVDPERVMDACRVLGDQQLAVFQRLYVAGLTAPGDNGYPFTIRRSLPHLACIEVFPAKHPQYKFLVRTPEEVEGVVAKAEAILAALNDGKPTIHSHACCPLATFRPCVCDVSFDCPLHGQKCYGTHD